MVNKVSSKMVDYLQGGTGSTTRALEDKLQDVVSVKDFGAVGDGVVDDTAAVQAAIDSGASKLVFPAGTYIVTSLTPVSDQMWVGDGKDITILKWAQSNLNPFTQSMVEQTGDVANVGFFHMTFHGNLDVQTTAGAGQDGIALKFRTGSIQNFEVGHCKFTKFGDQSKADGGGIFVAPLTGTNETVENIYIHDCDFIDIANTGGVYVAGKKTIVDTIRNIRVVDNYFEIGQYQDQNCVYILTDAGAEATPRQIDNVEVRGNSFYKNTTGEADVGIEINEALSAVIANNTFSEGATSDGITPILIRSFCEHVVITGNTMLGGGNVTTARSAIAITPFTSGDTIQDVIISNNSAREFETDIVSVSGADNVVVSANVLRGIDTGGQSAIKLANSTSTNITNNVCSNTRYGVLLGTGSGTDTLRAVLINGNLFYDIGGASRYIISTVSTNEDIEDLIVQGNIVRNPKASTSAFIILDAAASTGNIVWNNDHGGLPEFATSQDHYDVFASPTIWKQVTVGQADLATSGTKVILPMAATRRGRIRNMVLVGRTNFDAGGDRDISIGDGTNVYSLIPAATAKAIATNGWENWGSANFPMPAATAFAESYSPAGGDLQVNYSGGATDYVAGSFVIMVEFELTR